MGCGAQLGLGMMSGGNGSVWMTGERDGEGEKWTKKGWSREEQSRNRKVSFWIITGGTFTAGTEEGLYMGLRVKLTLEFGSEERSGDSAEV